MEKRISSKYYASDWSIAFADKDSPDWTHATEIIKDRFETRYFNPLAVLINHCEKEVRNNSGFIIMSIDCLLIETLNQFYLGLKNTNCCVNYKGKGNNWRAFSDFFKYSTYFPDFKNNDDLVEEFYRQIRCGLLHQAESKVNSLINVRHREMVKPIQNGNYKHGMIINRTLFHDALKREFEKYLIDLEDPESLNLFGENLREKCRKKMKAICP